MGAIFGIIGSAFASFFSNMLASFFAAKTNKELGADTQALATEKQANEKVASAEAAVNAVVPLTPASLQLDAKTHSDPDFRD